MIYFLLNAFEGDKFLLLCFRISYIFYFMLQKGINLLQKVTYFLQHALRFLLNYFRYDCNPHILGTLDYCVHFMSRTPTIPEEKVTLQTLENIYFEVLLSQVVTFCLCMRLLLCCAFSKSLT